MGLVTGSVTPRARAKPWVKVVLPAPRSPLRTRRSPGSARRANAEATAFVSSGVEVRSTNIVDPTIARRLRRAPGAARSCSGTRRRQPPVTYWRGVRGPSPVTIS